MGQSARGAWLGMTMLTMLQRSTKQSVHPRYSAVVGGLDAASLHSAAGEKQSSQSTFSGGGKKEKTAQAQPRLQGWPTGISYQWGRDRTARCRCRLFGNTTYPVAWTTIIVRTTRKG